MVSAQRIWDKLNRMESKIMAYHVMQESGVVPHSNEVLKFPESRLGKQATEMDLVRSRQAQFDIKQDILKNIEKLELTEKDYLSHLKKEGLKDLASIIAGIGKEEKKSA